jgi:cell division protein FtsB
MFRKHRFLFLALLLFGVLIAFLDKNNLLNNWRLHRKIQALEQKRDYYETKIVEDSLVLEQLQDVRFLERYAREHFYMKRPDETIYIVR